MRSQFKIDIWLLVPVAVLVTVSLITLLSVNSDFFKSQLLSLVIAVIAFLFFSQINTDSIKQLKLPIYIVSLILLGIVLFLGIESRGAVRWIDIFGVRFQFSEILKPFLAFAFASFVAEKRYRTMKSFFIILIFLSPVIFLIYLQPDLGNALIFLGVALFALIVAGFPFRWFVISALPVIVLSPFIWTMLHEYQRQRVLTFFHKTSDPLGTSYNSIQAIIAVGAGTFFGKGLSQGTQSGLRFLPERHTDFIFATIAEELGFVGAIIIIVASIALCYRIYVIFKNSNNALSKIFVACSFGFILMQCFVNIGMNIGIAPIVGVTLPFVSFGGSSLVSNFIFLGILSSFSSSHKNKDVLEIR
jgi:rod shape determining protein RodA